MKIKSFWKRLSILLVATMCLELVPQMNTQVNAALLSSELKTDELISEPETEELIDESASETLIDELDTESLVEDDADDSLIISKEVLNDTINSDLQEWNNKEVIKKGRISSGLDFELEDYIAPGGQVSADGISVSDNGGILKEINGKKYKYDSHSRSISIILIENYNFDTPTVEKEATILVPVSANGYAPYEIKITAVLSTKQTQELIFDGIEVLEKTTNDTSFTVIPKLRRGEEQVSENLYSHLLRYSSCDTSVATVDNTGRVTIMGSGATSIKAVIPEDATYLEDEAYYDLIVSYVPAPKPTWSKESVEWTATYADTVNTAKAMFHLKKNTTASDNSVTVSASQIELVSETNTEKTFRATVTYENQKFTDTKTVKKIWTKESVDWTAKFTDTPTSVNAVFNLKSNALSDNTISLSADNIILLSEDDISKTFKAILTYEGYNFEDEYTVYSHTEHKWTVSFNWISVSTNGAETKVTAEASCNNGGERRSLSVNLGSKTVNNKIEYTATATDPAGKKWTSKKHINSDGTIGDGAAGKEIGKGLVIVGLEDEYDYTGKQIKPAFQVIDEARDDTVLALNVDYTVKYGANKDPGEKAGSIEVKGKGNYTGSATSATFAIVNRRAELSTEEQSELVNLKGASVRISEKFTYTGEPQYPKSFELKLKGGSWTKYDTEDGRIYKAGDNELKAVVTFSNNVNKGTATLLLEGATDDKGKITTIKKSFSIRAADLKDAKFAEGMEGTYTVKGAKPDELIVTWQANEDTKELTLVEGQDFKVKYSDNKSAGTGKIVITGKGNFTKKAEGGTFKINPMEVEAKDISVVVSDKTAANKVKVTILDADGNALNQNKQLNVTVTGEDGIDLGKNKVKSGDKIYVNVKSKDTTNVSIDEAGIDVTIAVGEKLSKAKVAVNGYAVTFTGSPVTLDAEAFKIIKVTLGGTELKYGVDFIITGYKNNNKKGTMTVTICGIENNTEGAKRVSGTKTFKVKINPKPVSGD